MTKCNFGSDMKVIHAQMPFGNGDAYIAKILMVGGEMLPILTIASGEGIPREHEKIPLYAKR